MTRERKLILFIGVTLLIVGAVYRFAPDYESVFVADDEIASKQIRLAKYRTMLKEQSAVKARFDYSRKMVKQAEKRLLSGTTQALAAVDMQNIIKGITYKAGIEVKSFQVLAVDDSEDTEYIDIPVRFQISCTARQLKDIIYGIETADKLLRITEVNAAAIKRRPRPKPIEPVFIRTMVTVSGYMARG